MQPSIFGSLLEGGLGHDQQWRLGAHYTHEADIQKVVQPTIVGPWRERIENLGSHREAVAAQGDMLNYVVLDPACGSGNFLYVAYRELRRLEQRLQEREVELRRREGLRDQGSLSLHFPLSNVRGIEIDGFAVALARVTLWMGHKLAVDELGLSESTLPLGDLSGIQVTRCGWSGRGRTRSSATRRFTVIAACDGFSVTTTLNGLRASSASGSRTIVSIGSERRTSLLGQAGARDSSGQTRSARIELVQ